MDFKRIKWIFLIVFIGINIFLGVEIIQAPKLLSNTPKYNLKNSTTLAKELQNNNIKVPATNNQQSGGYYLAASSDSKWITQAKKQLDGEALILAPNTNEKSLTAKLAEPIEVSKNKKEALKEIEKFKDNSQYVYNGKDYVYVADLSSKQDYVFLQKTPYGVLYANRARLHINLKDNQIVSYYQRYTNKVFPVRERQTTISSQAAIRSLYTYSELPNNSKVLWIKFAYTKLVQVRGSVIFLPSWVAAIENNDNKSVTYKKVNAFTGAMINDQKGM
ncbi:hypothetical protein FP435_07515 [Lactobacillus sp. PV037]|uniref:two-component system regulatory protein YycI n=1 Tax=unclassified Lactobacillus TaxID=2620435 RepID=UPI00223F1734|nr:MULTISPECIES: two-component system regulatory protein YycI [unclassified Lactobacillus]QNQ81677.1 hypothetical protein FP433_00740 [Lactobacillus sp. PV012]QNQ84276.1 hypothetical protein FP435_07515 [Lactobacillus sp. PV037]